jgi:hypothetical protein
MNTSPVVMSRMAQLHQQALATSIATDRRAAWVEKPVAVRYRASTWKMAILRAVRLGLTRPVGGRVALG